MKTEIELCGGKMTVATTINMDYSSACDSLNIYCGPFILFGLADKQVRTQLIAALQEADAELDAAEEARKEDGEQS